VIGWAGLRGAVSLAAALALPLDFPERDLIIWLTLCVIFATLVLQGLTLPRLIQALGMPDDHETQRQGVVARQATARAALERIDALYAQDWVRADSRDRLRAMYEFRLKRLKQRAGVLDLDTDLNAQSLAYQRAVRELLDTQRAELLRLRNTGEISNDVMHEVTRDLDLEDQRLEI
jgi:monovalent cation/hydrogen antiporter